MTTLFLGKVGINPILPNYSWKTFLHLEKSLTSTNHNSARWLNVPFPLFLSMLFFILLSFSMPLIYFSLIYIVIVLNYCFVIFVLLSLSCLFFASRIYIFVFYRLRLKLLRSGCPWLSGIRLIAKPSSNFHLELPLYHFTVQSAYLHLSSEDDVFYHEFCGSIIIVLKTCRLLFWSSKYYWVCCFNFTL